MKTILLLLACLSLFTLASAVDEAPPQRKEIGNLVIEGVPDIPPELAERIHQYENTRAADFQGWHPDGNGILILTRFGNTDQVHSVSGPGSDRRQLTFFEEPISLASYPPQKNPGGFLFSMDQGGGEFFQLYWFESRHGKHKLLTDGARSRNVNPVWSNSGHAFAFSSTSRNGKDFDIYVLENLDPKSKKLVKQVTGSWEVLEWSPDDQKLLLREYISINESYLSIHDLRTGKSEEITPRSGNETIAYGPAKFARTGNSFFYTSDEGTEFRHLFFYDAGTKQKTILSKEIPWDITGLDVSKDGKWIAYVANEGGKSALYLSEARVPLKPVKIALPEGVLSGIKFDLQGKRLAMGLSQPTAPEEAYIVDIATRKASRWTFSELGGLPADAFVEPQLIQYPSFDGKQIPAFYYRAKNKTPSSVVIYIHGGPESQIQATFYPIIQYWVNELGISVLTPNVRGSNGYGKNYLMLDNGRKREDSVKDIGKLLDWIGTRPELDAKRVAVYGGSYGGYMVLASMTHFNDRLRCAVDIVGISNFVTFLESTEAYRRDLRRAEYGDERDPEMRKILQEISPLNRTDRISKPILVIQGKNDPRVPVSESEQLVQAIRKNGGSVWYIMAKDEGHGFKKKVNRDFYYNAVSLFFQKHL